MADPRQQGGPEEAEPGQMRGEDAPDAGSPGGMGGASAQGGTGRGRPPGGVSPVPDDEGHP